MVVLNGNIIAELNDINTIKAGGLLEDRLVCGYFDKEINQVSEINGLIYVDDSKVQILKLIPNSYLSTDINGNLIFKEL